MPVDQDNREKQTKKTPLNENKFSKHKFHKELIHGIYKNRITI